MSVVYITHHNESIYDSTKITREIDKKPPFYKSKFNRTRKASAVKQQDRCRPLGSMGKPKQPPPDPCEYLKKNSYKLPTIPCTAEEREEMKTLPRREMLPVPRRCEVLKEQDAKLKHDPKKFITKNIKMVLCMKPKLPETNVVLDCHGTKKNLKDGLEPRYIHMNVFGKTPNYIKHVIAEREEAIQQERDNIGLMQPKCKYITSSEREKLLMVGYYL